MEIHVCDSCGHEVAGYTKDELTKDGWKWNLLTEDAADKRRFVTCGECEAHFAERRATAVAASAPQ